MRLLVVALIVGGVLFMAGRSFWWFFTLGS